MKWICWPCLLLFAASPAAMAEPASVSTRPATASGAVHVVEAERMAASRDATSSESLAGASDGEVLRWKQASTDASPLRLQFELPQTAEVGRHRVFVRLVKGPAEGMVRLDLNGTDAGWPVDLWAERLQVTPPIDLGVHDLRAQGNKLTVTVVGANAKARGRTDFAVDALQLTSPDAPPPGDPLVSAGPFQHIYDPGVGEDEQWYINDHSVIHGNNGKWHLFGITREEPPHFMQERNLAHATSPELTAWPWEKQPFALTAEYEQHGEVHLWAPHVIEHDGTYYMYYCAGASHGQPREEVTAATRDPRNYRIHLATSTDLWEWERHEENPLFTDGWSGRDPMVIRLPEDLDATGASGESLAGKWIMYYTATDPPDGGNRIVAYRTSDDLIHWSDRAVAYRDPTTGRGGGTTESPFVVRRGDWYYLFIAPRGGPGNGYAYAGTDIFRSRSPVGFKPEDIVGHIPAHAAEVVRDTDGQWYITHCGWGQGGVYLAPLRWHDGLGDAPTSLPPPDPTTRP